jgi:hypothetical protein
MFECDDAIIANVSEEIPKKACAYPPDFLSKPSDFLENGML